MSMLSVVRGNCFGVAPSGINELFISLFWLLVIVISIQLVLKFTLRVKIDDSSKVSNNDSTDINDLKLTESFRKKSHTK